MIHKIVTVTCLVVVFTLGVLSVKAYDNHQVQVRVASAKAQASQAYHDKLQRVAVAAEHKRVNDECHKGQAAYDSQTVVYQKAHKADRPVCDLPTVQ